MNELTLLSSATTASVTPSDPNFKNVTLLLNGDGTNGAQNNTFVDSSTNNFTITRNGNTTQGSFSPYGSNWSNFFNGSTTSLSTTNNAAFDFGTSSFTLEAWVYLNGNAVVDGNGGRTAAIFGCGNTTQTSIVFYIGGDANTTGTGFGIYKNQNTEQGFGATITIPQNSWQHLAVSKSDSSIRFFLNGTQVGTTQTSTTAWGSSSLGTFVGRMGQNNVNWFFPGYISNFRITKTAVYTSNFTPSATPLTAISGTSLLTCQSNRFIDASSNNFAITVAGTPSVQRFSSFAPTAAYSISTIGGSGYFDGSGDNLKVPAGSAFAYGTGNFTIEGWFYVTAALPQYGRNLFAQTVSGTTYLLCTLSDGTGNNPPANKVQFSTQTMGALSGATTFALNTWNHFAVVRNSGSVTVYLNGVGGTPVASTDNFTNTTYVPTIGNWTHDSTNQTFIGHLSDFRVTKSAVYTSNFTPSSAPLTNITNTSLLANMSNAGISDLAMQNDLETVGNAQVSTSVKKYGTGSLAFDGTGDYITTAFAPQSILGTSNWTAECWINVNNTSSSRNIFSINADNNTFAAVRVTITATASLQFLCASNSTTWINTSETANSLISSNTWYHIAAVRNGSTFTLYVDGVSRLSYTSTASLYNPSGVTIVSAFTSSGGVGNFFHGYIDDLRITNGIARYTANFTPPAATFPTL